MTTEVTLTGTGVPHSRPGLAGAGTLVRCGDVTLQFDAGRSTVDLRDGGCTGTITVGEDLMVVPVGGERTTAG